MSRAKEYRLQLLSHGEIFNSREDAVRYINNNFKKYALWAEPAIVYYENEDGELRMILTVGATQDPDHKRIYIMDDGELRETVENASNTVSEFAGTVATISDDLLSTIEAAGLVLDENNITDRVEYRPNINDDVIKNSTTLADAIEAVSAYAQNVMEFAEEAKEHDVVYKTKNSEHNVRLTISEPEDDGDGHMVSYISADVKRSNDDYNMLEIRDDRLFVPTISGGETDSTRTEVVVDENGGKTIRTRVREDFCSLSNDGNTITLTIGDSSQSITLPGVNIIKRIDYDPENNNLIIVYYSGEGGSEESTVEFPVDDIFDITEFTDAIAEINSKIDEVYHGLNNKIDEAYHALNNKIDTTEQTLRATDDLIYAHTEANKNSIEVVDGKVSDLEDLVEANTQSLSSAIQDIQGDFNHLLIKKVADTTSSTTAQYQLILDNVAKEGSDTIVMPSIKLVQDEHAPRTFNLMVDEVNQGSVVIPEEQDKFLERVYVDGTTLHLVFITDAGEQDVAVDLSNIDTYNAGNGIAIDEHEVSVKLSSLETNLLEFVEGGYLKTKDTVATMNDVNNVQTMMENDYATKEEVGSLSASLENKANAADVYTKNATDTLLDGKQDALSGSDTISIDNNVVSVKIGNSEENVIIKSNDGLYVNVEYNPVTNVLSFSGKPIQLSYGLVQSCRYDSETDSIIISYQDGGGTTRDVSIPVSGMIDDMIKVADTNTVDLNVNSGGDKTITANVKLAAPSANEVQDPDRRENAIKSYDNGIFVSKFADQYKAVYTVDNTNQIISVQEYLETLNRQVMANTANIQNLINEINELNRRVSDLEELNPEVVDYGLRIERLERMVGDYNDTQGDNDPSNDGWDDGTF